MILSPPFLRNSRESGVRTLCKVIILFGHRCWINLEPLIPLPPSLPPSCSPPPSPRSLLRLLPHFSFATLLRFSSSTIPPLPKERGGGVGEKRKKKRKELTDCSHESGGGFKAKKKKERKGLLRRSLSFSLLPSVRSSVRACVRACVHPLPPLSLPPPPFLTPITALR